MFPERIKCSRCNHQIKGRVRKCTGVFKAQMDNFTAYYNIPQYEEGLPFCNVCKNMVSNFELRGPPRLNQRLNEQPFAMEADEITEVTSIAENDPNSASVESMDTDETSASEMRQTIQAWQQKFQFLECRIVALEAHLGLHVEETLEWTGSFERAIQTLESRTEILENVIAEDHNDRDVLMEPDIVYSESGSSEIIVDDFTPCKKSVRHERGNEIVAFPARTIPHTERFCVVCQSPNDRATVPHSAILNLVIEEKILLNPKVRACRSHYLPNGRFNPEAKLRMLARVKEAYPLRISTTALWKLVVSLADAALCRPSLLTFSEETSEKQYEIFLGVSKDLFTRLHTTLALHMKNTSTRTTRDALAILLVKLRLGIPQRTIGYLFGITSQSTISSIIHRVTNLMSEHVVPKHLGWEHISREEALLHQQNGLAMKLFGVQPGKIVLIADGTYVDIQKPANHELQYKTYCLHKYKNLVKEMMIILEDGYILDADGPWFSNSKNNDASIFKAIMMRKDGLRKFVEEKDTIIFDRGFGQVIEWIREQGIHAFIPHFLARGQKQFTPIQADENRCITKVRFRVEVVNGRINQRWRFFDHVVELPYIPIIGPLFRICCALHNMDFKPIVSDIGREEEILNAFLEEREPAESLLQEIKDLKLDKKRKCWEPIVMYQFGDFPKLTIDDLLSIGLGSFQIRNAIQYIKRSDFYILKQNWKDATFALMRGKLRSRYHNADTQYCYVEFVKHGESYKSIGRRECGCIGGLRRNGVCSHIMALIMLFGYLRYHPEISEGTEFMSFVLDAAELMAQNEDPANAVNESDIETEVEEEFEVVDVMQLSRHGLPNVGNSCYLNAVLQLLFCIPEVTRNIQFCSPLAIYYKAVFEAKIGIEVARKAKKALSDRLSCFNDTRQHDAHEFLLALVNYEPLSELKELLLIRYEISRSCACGYQCVNEEIETEFIVNPLDPIESQIMGYCQIASLSMCICGLSLSTRRSIKALPKYAVVVYRIYNNLGKLSGPLLEETFAVNMSGICATYKLLSCVTHIGDHIESGHYTAFVFSNTVCCFNDDRCSRGLNEDGSIYICLYALQ